MKQQQDVQKRERAERAYARFLRLYPRAHRQAFGEPMLQAFRDHYRDAIETEGEQTARFWLSVIGDGGKSLLREHIAAFAERISLMKMLLVAPTLGLWQRRQTRGLALVAQLAIIAAVLLMWAPPLFSRVAFAVGLPDLVSSNSGLGTYCLSAAVERPTSSFITTFSGASGAGNGDYRGELRQAVKAQSLPLSQAVVRLDGQYGNGAIVGDVAGLSFVMRGKDYDLLDFPEVRARLSLPPDQQTTHPETGTCRALFDCPDLNLSPAGSCTRVIIAAHPAAKTVVFSYQVGPGVLANPGAMGLEPSSRIGACTPSHAHAHDRICTREDG